MKKNHHRLILLIAGFQFLALGSFAQTVLFAPTDSAGAVPQPEDSTIIKSINIRINNDLLTNEANKKFLITLPAPGVNPGITVSIVRTRVEPNPKFNSYSWYGKLENEPGSFVLLTQIKDVVSGYIRTEKNLLYRINYIGNGLHRISRINQRYYKPDKVDNPPTAVLSMSKDMIAKSGRICNDAVPGGVIDVLVCYTVAAKDRAGGVRAIETAILNAADLTNQSYFNSQITHRIALTNMVQVTYTETRTGTADRDRLQNPSDGYLDGVQRIRDTESADIVVLFVADAGTFSGYGYVMDNPSPAFEALAFCVVKLDDASLNLAFAHEIGHIMGAEHDCEHDDGTTPISYPYSHGYRSGAFKTIMSVNAVGTRVEYWANTGVAFPGTSIPSGNVSGACKANDYRTLANGFEIVSKFRCRNSVPDPEPPPPIQSTILPRSITPDPKPDPISTDVKPDPRPVPPEPDSHWALWSPRFWMVVSISLIIVSFFILFFWRRRKQDREIKK